MTTSKEYLALAERAENGETGRGLDAQIMCAFEGREMVRSTTGKLLGRSLSTPHDTCVILWADGTEADMTPALPRYTTSLDAIEAARKAQLPDLIWVEIRQCCEHAGWKNERWFWRSLASVDVHMVWSKDAPTECASRLAAMLRTKAKIAAKDGRDVGQ